MNLAEKIADSRRRTTPLFNDRKLKLGTFGTNLDRGCAITDIEGVLEIDWPNTRTLAQLADAMEFEAVVPIGRWRGFGGTTNFNGPGFECFAWAAGISASTDYSAVFATSHVPTIHPVMAAKQAAAIDHISGGRFALNIVTGWHRPEIEMFGAPLMDHDDRYECAAEWLTIVRKLWEQDGEFDFEGRFYKITRGFLEPKPVQKPSPPIMNAGGSEKGRHFAAKYCDMVYVVFGTHDFDECKQKVEAYRSLAREEYGREIQVWSYAYLVQGETEKEAKDYYDYYVNQKGDWEAASNLVNTMGLNAKTLPPHVLQAMKADFIAGWGGYPLIGTKEQIVDGLTTMSKMGLDGTLLNWPRYIDDMRYFQKNIYPLVQQTGLR
jgi:alkanesulfonate monooxygenase SsuD/methylene tetrahydromethanopterin reductase-like flavin-dependent oxidoreductase (luciferase family)